MILESPVSRLDSVVKRWPTDASHRWTASFLTTACSTSNVLAVVIIGSSIREVSEPTDIDILAIYRNRKPKFDRAPIEVDVRMYNQESVQSSLDGGHDLLNWAVKFGHVLCEREGYWTNLVTSWKPRMRLPSAAVAEERAESAEHLYNEFLQIGDEAAAAEQLVYWLTHVARAALIRAGVFPESRPEIPKQLRGIHELDLAVRLESALQRRNQIFHGTTA